MKPVLFVTGHAPAYRVGAFERLHAHEEVCFALFGGDAKHGGAPFDGGELPFPHSFVSEREVCSLAGSGRYRAVVCSTGGRLALPAAWAGARRARVPLVLWASLWAHPRSAALVLGYPALRRLYRSADAVVTYGPHVSAYVRAHGAHNVHVAPQSVDNDFWGSPQSAACADTPWPAGTQVKFLFAGRQAREKGVGVLEAAWLSSGLEAPTAALVLVGVGPTPPWVPAGGAVCVPMGQPDVRRGLHRRGREAIGDGAGVDAMARLSAVAPEELRSLYAQADVLVVPSIPTRTFREPWGLVVNEAMNQGVAVIASDAVGAAAGGLVSDGHNGLVVRAGDREALADALGRLASEHELRRSMGEAGRRDVQDYTHDAWAVGFSRALGSVHVSRARC
jgi:glycosyltransferase involved in cell wall biosynthesis